MREKKRERICDIYFYSIMCINLNRLICKNEIIIQYLSFAITTLLLHIYISIPRI